MMELLARPGRYFDPSRPDCPRTTIITEQNKLGFTCMKPLVEDERRAMDNFRSSLVKDEKRATDNFKSSHGV